MARELSLSCSFLIIVGVMHIVTFLVTAEPQVPCYFIFGDSLVDSGNNNNLATAAKANYRPYGIDFPRGVTGRFTNGRTVADLIGQLLGFAEFIPPYATATDQEISTGVNYGSGSAGIREESGSHLGDRISLDRQLNNHIATISRLSLLQSNKTFTNEYLKKCIYLSNIGSNDYINNYLMPDSYPTSNTYTVDEYAALLVEQYLQQLKTLYDLGARKVAVFGLGQIGCTPAEIARFGTNGKPCVEWINDAVKIFNGKLRSIVIELNNDYSDAKFTFINLTSISAPQGESFGAADVPIPSPPCCRVGEDGQCVPNSTPCLLRALSVFYDGFHPTETANTVIAARSYIALSPMDASPYDISHLARL
ncbi:GDSL esterase/lipase-like protein [Tanacetum coccineum]